MARSASCGRRGTVLRRGHARAHREPPTAGRALRESAGDSTGARRPTRSHSASPGCRRESTVVRVGPLFGAAPASRERSGSVDGRSWSSPTSGQAVLARPPAPVTTPGTRDRSAHTQRTRDRSIPSLGDQPRGGRFPGPGPGAERWQSSLRSGAERIRTEVPPGRPSSPPGRGRAVERAGVLRPGRPLRRRDSSRSSTTSGSSASVGRRRARDPTTPSSGHGPGARRPVSASPIDGT